MIDVKLSADITNAFGPSGYEHDVAKVVMNYMEKDFNVRKDAMQNVYATFKQGGTGKPILMLDAHTDEVGFMVAAIKGNGLITIQPLGGWVEGNVPAHTVYIKNKDGKLIKGITTSKPPHFMSAADMAKKVEYSDIQIDVGATSRDEVINDFGIVAGQPVMPDVTFEYNEKTGVLFGKAFDCRLGCQAIIHTMQALLQAKLDIEVVGAFATQEEVGVRGAKVTSQTVLPKVAIVFEGTPSDDFIIDPIEAQGRMKKGVQIRYRDGGMISNPLINAYACEIAEKNGIPFQRAVRASGSTNGAAIHTAGAGVPTLVLGIPTRYAHTHYCYASAIDLQAAIDLAVAIAKDLTPEKIEAFKG